MTITQGSIQSFVAGTVLIFTGTFTDTESGALIDPSEVAFAYQIENQTPVYVAYDGGTGPVERVSVGTYAYELDTTGLAAAGRSVLMQCQFAGSGSAQASDAITIRLSAPPIAWRFP